jgi:4-hydroxy-tetrahydrodipicolinate synthase
MYGIHTALVTPFDAGGDVDLDAFVRLIDRQLAAGVHGLVACGTTGETPTLSAEEWTALVAATVERVGGRVPVTAGVGTNATASTVRNVERAAALGADAGLLVFPYYNKPNPSGLRAHVHEALRVGLPLVLYHVPGRTGQRLPVETLAEFASLDGVIAVKEATGDVTYGTDLIARTATPVLSGDDFTFLGLLAQGGAGCVSVVSNVDPGRTVAAYDAWRAGRVDDARVAVRELWSLIGWLFCESNPVPCKAALAHLGLCRADVRLPLGPFGGPSPAAMLEALGLS